MSISLAIFTTYNVPDTKILCVQGSQQMLYTEKKCNKKKTVITNYVCELNKLSFAILFEQLG